MGLLNQFFCYLLLSLFVVSSLPINVSPSSQIILEKATQVQANEIMEFGPINQNFIRNDGQVSNEDILYYVTGYHQSVGFRKSGVSIILTNDDMIYHFMISFNGSFPTLPVGEQKLPGDTNFISGNDRLDWISNVPRFSKITYDCIYEKIDLCFYFSNGKLKYDYKVWPGGEITSIKMNIEGAKVNINGEKLIYSTLLGDMFEEKPISYLNDGSEIPTSWKLYESNIIGFEVEDYDPEHVIVIDPALDFSTFIGGTLTEINTVIDIFEEDIYLTGTTNSQNFPTCIGAYQTSLAGNEDVFVFRLASDGMSMVKSTYIGGYNTEKPTDILVRDDGKIIITGNSNSVDMPTSGEAYDTSYNGGTDAFILILNNTFSSIDFGTYLGGSSVETSDSLFIDNDNNIYLSGYTRSTDFPTTSGAFSGSNSGKEDVFILKLDPTISNLVFSTYIGGSSDDEVNDMILDQDGNILLTGFTYSSNFPVTSNAISSILHDIDCFITRLNSSGDDVIDSTFFGGVGFDVFKSIVVETNGSILCAGYSGSSLPIPQDAYQNTNMGEYDGIVIRFSSSLDKFMSGTYFGGSNDEYTEGMCIDNRNYITIVGGTDSSDFPTSVDSLNSNQAGLSDAFLITINSSMNCIHWSTLIGGAGSDAILSAELSDEWLYLSGLTSSANFPITSSAYDTQNNGFDAFIQRLNSGTFSPISLKISSGYLFNNISWKEPGGGIFKNHTFISYHIYRGLTPGNLSLIASVNDAYHYYDIIPCFNNRDYYYAITTEFTDLGNSSMSNIMVGTPLIPSRPRFINYAEGDMRVDLEWDVLPREVTDLYPILYYRLFKGERIDVIQPIAETTSNKFIDQNLNCYPTEYFYQVTYILKTVGEGLPSDALTVKPNSPPSDPINIHYLRGDKNTTLFWENPADNGGYPIINYLIFIGANPLQLEKVGTTMNSTFLFENQIPGRLFFYRIIPENSLGVNNRTPIIKAWTVTVPSPPEGLYYYNIGNIYNIAWGVPLETWSLPILSYKIYMRSGPASSVQISEIESDVQEYSGLNPGNDYYVTALNQIGESSASRVISISDCWINSKFMGLSLETGDREIRISWNVSSINVSYTQINVYRGINSSSLLLHRVLPAGLIYFEDNNLINGQSYYYKISAGNENGEGPLSDLLMGIPGKVPGILAGFSVKPGLNYINLTWSSPSDIGGWNITSFILYRGLSPMSLTPIQSFSSNVFSYTDDVTSPNVTYYYSITTLNPLGESKKSVIISSCPISEPGSPIDVVWSVIERKIQLSWRAPVANGGTNIQGYKIYWKPEKDLEYSIESSTLTKYTIWGLRIGTRYQIKITAMNTLAEGSPTQQLVVPVGTPPAAPVNLDVMYSQECMNILFDNPYDGGFPISSHLVVIENRNEQVILQQVLSSDQRTLSITGLCPGEPFTLKVASTNELGMGSFAVKENVIFKTIPSLVKDLEIISITEKNITIGWNLSIFGGGDQITSFNIYRGFEDDEPERIASSIRGHFYTDNNLLPMTNYIYVVRAVNSLGEGYPSNPLQVFTKFLPEKISNIRVENSIGKIKLIWTPNENHNNTSIDGFLILRGGTEDNLRVIAQVGSDSTEYLDEDTLSGNSYYSVVAFNEIGSGEDYIIKTNPQSGTIIYLIVSLIGLLIPILIVIIILIFIKKKNKTFQDEISKSERNIDIQSQMEQDIRMDTSIQNDMSTPTEKYPKSPIE